MPIRTRDPHAGYWLDDDSDGLSPPRPMARGAVRSRSQRRRARAAGTPVSSRTRSSARRCRRRRARRARSQGHADSAGSSSWCAARRSAQQRDRVVVLAQPAEHRAARSHRVRCFHFAMTSRVPISLVAKLSVAEDVVDPRKIAEHDARTAARALVPQRARRTALALRHSGRGEWRVWRITAHDQRARQLRLASSACCAASNSSASMWSAAASIGGIRRSVARSAPA